MMTFPTLMNKRGRCLIMRTFAPDARDVSFRVDQVFRTVAAFDGISFEKRPSVSQILILVFANPRYGSRADCGLTAAALRKVLGTRTPNLGIPITIEEMKHGEPYSSMLNYAIQVSGRFGCDYSLVLSPEVQGYVTGANLEAMYKACCNGALAAGLVISELRETLLDSGGVSNACAIWCNAPLALVHGFDRYSALPLGKSQIETSDASSAVYRGGGEEWIPLRWLADEHGECIAPVIPEDDAAAYQTPDPTTQADLWLRYEAMRSTKLGRRNQALAFVQASPDALVNGVMKQYRGSLLR